jgi:hypothetical protein
MHMNYQLNADELDIKFINSLKEFFKNKEIIIHISEISDNNYIARIPGMVDSINEGLQEDVSECANLKDIGWE